MRLLAFSALSIALLACSSNDDPSATAATGSPSAGQGGSSSAGQGGSSAAGSPAAGAAGSNAAGSNAAGSNAAGSNAAGASAAGQGGSGVAGSGQAGTSAAGSSAAGSSAAGSGGTGSGGFDPGGEVKTFNTGVGPLTVPSGGEGTKCIIKRLDNTEGVYVRRFYTTLPVGSHHMIVYRSKEKEEQLEPKPCQGFSGLLTGDHAIFIAQQKLSELAFPSEEGTPVALKIEPQQMVRIELHYFNTTDNPIDVTGDVKMDTIPLSSKVIESDLAFWGTQGINIPPHSTKSTPVKFQAALPGTKTFALTTHQHHYGTRMSVWHGAKGDQSKEVANESNWADPKLELYSPPLEFPADQKLGFSYQCEWNNTSSDTVSFGESINDEMCFLWHYYYPSKGFQLCVDGFCL